MARCIMLVYVSEWIYMMKIFHGDGMRNCPFLQSFLDVEDWTHKLRKSLGGDEVRAGLVGPVAKSDPHGGPDPTVISGDMPEAFGSWFEGE